MEEQPFKAKYTVIQETSPGLFKIVTKSNERLFLMEKHGYSHLPKLSVIEMFVYFNSSSLHDNLLELYNIELDEQEQTVYLIYLYQPFVLCNLMFKTLEQEHRLFVGYNIASTVAFFHKNGIALETLDSNRVFINEKCQVRLKGARPLHFVDLGVDDDSEQLDAMSLDYEPGYSYYKAPEVLLKGKTGPASDMWSFGVLLLELLSSSPVFNCRSVLELVQQFCHYSSWPSTELLHDMKVPKSNQQIFAMVSKTNVIEFLNPKHLQYKKIQNKDVCGLIDGLLQFNPKKRLAVSEVLRHPVFREFYRDTGAWEGQRWDIKRKLKDILTTSNLMDMGFSKNESYFKMEDEDDEESKFYFEKFKTSSLRDFLNKIESKKKREVFDRVKFSSLLLKNFNKEVE